jgi:uncharacterized protein (DUF305 family)
MQSLLRDFIFNCCTTHPTFGENMKTSFALSKKPFFSSLSAIALAAAAAGLTPAFAQSTSDMQHGDMKSMGSGGSMKMHMAMQDSQAKMNQMEMSGDTDRDFAMMMRAHHQAGIDMAKVEVASGKDAVMISEAKKIIASQQKDVEKFDAWLQKHPKK